jgi:hypothetical protein
MKGAAVFGLLRALLNDRPLGVQAGDFLQQSVALVGGGALRQCLEPFHQFREASFALFQRHEGSQGQFRVAAGDPEMHVGQQLAHRYRLLGELVPADVPGALGLTQRV